MSRAETAAEVVRAAKLLYARGLVNAYEGNVSMRLGETLLITPSQVCKGDLTAADLVEVAIEDGALVEAKPGRRASSEVKLHICAYKSRPDIGGVAHAHPPCATAYALAGREIATDAYPEMIILYGKVPLCRYGRPGTDDVNADVPGVLAEYDQFLLANHGLVTVGAGALEATYRLEGLESIAKVLAMAEGMGGERKLPPEEVETLLAVGAAMRKRG